MKTNFKRIGKQSLSIVLAVMMMVSTMLVGAITSNASSSYTVYFIPKNEWLTHNYSLKVNYNTNNTEDGWHQLDATDTGKTINSSKVYSGTFTLNEDKLYKLQFQAYEGTEWKDQMWPINSETSASSINEKCYNDNGSNWLTPVWDSEQPSWNLHYTVNGASPWKDESFSNSDTENIVTNSLTLATGDKVTFGVQDSGNTWYAPKSSDFTFTATNNTKELVTQGCHDAEFTATLAGTYTFSFNTSTKALTITFPKGKHTASVTTANATVKINDEEVSNGSSASFDDGSNVKIDVTPATGYEIDSVKINDTPEALTSTSSFSCTKNNVTSDLTIVVTTKQSSTPITDPIVYFANPVSGDNHWKNVYVHKWGGTATATTWPGQQQDKIYKKNYIFNGVTYDIYKIDVTNYESIIFNNNSQQTADIQLSNHSYGTCFTFNGDKKDPGTINFAIETYAVTVTSEYATVKVNDNVVKNHRNTNVETGKEYTVTVTPTEGATLTSVTVGGNVQQISNNSFTGTFTMGKEPVDIVAKATPSTTGTKFALLNNDNISNKKLSYSDGIAFSGNEVVVPFNSVQDSFAFVDDKGNYYGNSQHDGSTQATIDESFEAVKEEGKVSTFNVGGSASFIKFIIEKTTDSSITVKMEAAINLWKISGDNNYIKNSTWFNLYGSYKGDTTQYYYPVEVSDTSKDILFRLSDGVCTYRPSDNDTKEQIFENKNTALDSFKFTDSAESNNGGYFKIVPDTVGMYYICVDTENKTVWYEKADCDYSYVRLTSNADSITGAGAYISSYTDENGNSQTSTDKTVAKVKSSTNITLTAKAVEGYIIKWSTNIDDKTAIGETFTINSAYVTNGKDIIVTVKYEEIESYNVKVSLDGAGSVTATLDGVAQDISKSISVRTDKKLVLTATSTAEHIDFSGWIIDSDSYTLADGESTSSSTIHITPSENINVTAKFLNTQGTVDDTYRLMQANDGQQFTFDTIGSTVVQGATIYKLADSNKYMVTLQKSSIYNGNNAFAFTTGKGADTSPRDNMIGRHQSNDNPQPPKLIVDENAGAFSKCKISDRYENDSYGTNYKYYFIELSLNTNYSVKSISITYDADNYTYIVSADATQLLDSTYIYATNGSGRTYEDKNGLRYGVTTVTEGISRDYTEIDNSHTGFYTKYRAKKGDKVTVKCVMNSDEFNLGYYVYAFVVNGAKVDVVDMGKGVYQTESPLTITEKTEITPIYYNKNIEADGNYITIYTNAPKELQNSWGNSISIYSWYNNNGAEMDGAYPGQLMMRDSQGRFVAKVAKYAYSKNSEGKFVANENQKVLGITNSNYKEYQEVHPLFLSTDEQKRNHQTYDYDDFEKLTSMGYDTVEFDVKYFPGKTVSNQSKLLKDSYKYPTNKPFISETATDYQDLTNIDGKIVSILGYTDETAKNNNTTGLNTAEPLRIISVGNQYVKIDGKTEANKWSTIWYVYKYNNGTYEYVTRGLPSDFIPRGTMKKIDGKETFAEDAFDKQTQAYKDIVNNHLEYNSALISYEIEMNAKTASPEEGANDNSGYRIDGRWYYARSTDLVNVKLGIVFRDNDGDKWTVDKPTETSEITGKVTGGSASFDYTDSAGSSQTNLASAKVERNTVITVNATNGTQYKFIGWGTPTYDVDGKVTDYTPINLTDLNAKYTVSTNTELYAMYEPYDTDSGSVTITHSKYTGLNSHNGRGIFSVTAKVVNSNGDEIPSQISTQSDGSVKLDKIQYRQDAYIKVTLTTQSYAKSHFLNFYYPSVSKGVPTLTMDDNIPRFYDKECPANAPATNTFKVKVSDLFDSDGKTQKVMALNYYSDLKLPEVESDITFNYSPYKNAPSQNPKASNGTGKTTFTLTITKDDGTEVFPTTGDLSSLTLKANGNIKSIIEDYVANYEAGTDYTISINLNPKEDSHCDVGKSYRQHNDSGTYTYTEVGTKKVDIKLSEIYDISKNKFKTNTINLYTDFTAEEFNYNVTFKYLGYESREYYDSNGFTQDEIPPEASINNNWWRTYTVSGTFSGADIDKYFDYEEDQYKFKDSFLLDVAPYEDNFVQSITWDLSNVDYSGSKGELSVTATVLAKYKNDSVTVTADFGDGKDKKIYSVNYASLVTKDNLISTSTESNENSESKYLIVAPETNANGEKFSYWTIATDKGIVAKCYNTTFNYIAYDNYEITACYGMTDVDYSKLSVSATMQFLEYSRNKYDSGKDQNDSVKDKVYADFAVSYNYKGKMLCANINENVVCGVVFVVNSNYSSAADATDMFTVDKTKLLEKVKELNSGSSDKTMGESKVYNYKLDKQNLDNKNRLEYSWNVNNTENNQNLTILAYSYIYNTETDEFSVSAPQEFKFFNVGNKTYKG